MHTYRDQLLEPAPLRDVLRQPKLLPLKERVNFAVFTLRHYYIVIYYH